MTAIFLGFGLIVGSFLNVLILRYGARGLGGRSACMSCGRQISWYDNVPVLSWMLLRGRCRFCGARISIQYPLVEATTALLFATIGAAPMPLELQIVSLPIAALLVAITVYDLKHTIIPDAWVYSFAALALFSSFVVVPPEGYVVGIDWLSLLLSGPIVAFPLFLLWLFSRGTWMGLGDAKLALGMGWLLGWSSGLASIFLAFILGGAFSAPLLLLSSGWWQKLVAAFTPYHLLHTALDVKAGTGFTMKSEIPFGPFLIVGCLIMWFSEIYHITIPFPWLM